MFDAPFPETAIVTGGRSGIGAAIVAALEADGVDVEVLDLADGFDVGDVHGATALQEPASDGASDAGRAAGDEDDAGTHREAASGEDVDARAASGTDGRASVWTTTSSAASNITSRGNGRLFRRVDSTGTWPSSARARSQ